MVSCAAVPASFGTFRSAAAAPVPASSPPADSAAYMAASPLSTGFPMATSVKADAPPDAAAPVAMRDPRLTACLPSIMARPAFAGMAICGARKDARRSAPVTAIVFAVSGDISNLRWFSAVCSGVSTADPGPYCIAPAGSGPETGNSSPPDWAGPESVLSWPASCSS